MHAYIVSFEVRICLLTVHFFFLAQNGAIASIMNNIRYKVLEEAQFCDFCASSLAVVFGNCALHIAPSVKQASQCAITKT